MLHIHRAERADGLVAALAALLAAPPADPFAAEVVAVPTRGMERWLAQRMSGRLGATPGRTDGVCANVDFPSPRRMVDDAVAAASGIDPDEDPWLPERMVWPLLELVDAALDEPWLRPLAAHLDPEHGRRFAGVRRIADLLDRYALHRPAMVGAWSVHSDIDGAGRPLRPDAAWQAELWRRLRARIAAPDPAARLHAACDRLRTDPGIAALPERMSVFGLTRLPAARLEVLRALATRRDVHVFVLHPSSALWRSVDAAATRPVTRRRDDPTAALPANRLLASWGQDARELQLVLAAAQEHADHHHPVPAPDETLLARLQADVRADRAPPGAPLPGEPDTRPPLEDADRSVEVHACHGRARQAEVLHHAILHALDADTTLEPRDVIVMCPDIETFAPLVQATFGAGGVAGEEDEPDPLPPGARPPDLHVRLADRSLRQTNPILGVVATLLELAAGRVTASQVLDLADRVPVRRRFRFDDDDLERMEEWVAESGIRWGLDAEHRAPFKLERLAAGTWEAGLDRVLTGVAMTEDERELFHGVLPLDGVESAAIDLAGRLAELVDRLHAALRTLSRPQPIDAWATALAGAADALSATGERDAWQRLELQRVLDDVVAEAAGSALDLTLPEVRALLAERLQGRPTRANFRTGHLTVCTLVPMRSVPHRVVCLLGLDDGEFPRRATRDGDDLMLDEPHVGDRDPRAEDRQLLLDALLAATDRLIVTYSGNDERSNAPRPPAVPVGELLDVIDRTVRTDRGAARDRVVVRHPLQPFDARNFALGELVPARPWSFDRVALDGARATVLAARPDPPPFLRAPLPAAPPARVGLEDLVRFVGRPVREFLRQRLELNVSETTRALNDALPVELDHLETWGVGQRLLEARLAGVPLAAAEEAELARGALPPGRLADRLIARVRPVVMAIAAQPDAGADDVEPARSVDVTVALPGGRSLGGTVAGVRRDLLREVTYARVGPRQRLAAWVRLLALTAADPQRLYSAVVVGRIRRGGPALAEVTVVRIAPLAATAEEREQAALEHLAVLVDLYDRGMREPLPLAVATSAAYAQIARAGGDAIAAGRAAWESGWSSPREDAAPEHLLAFGRKLTFAELQEQRPRPDEDDESWPAAETTRFGRLARRLWDGPLDYEDRTDR